MERLSASLDPFGGIVILPEDLPEEPGDFVLRLAYSLAAWRQEAIKQVWLTISLEHARLIPLATAAGFLFHHCAETRIGLHLRLLDDAVAPPGPTHLIGVGAVVLSDKGDLLVVREKYEHRPGFYKLPGGLLNPDEHLAEAVTREVREETGIESEFYAVLCLTHLHRWQFGKSNIYLVCRLTPTTQSITIDKREIAEAKWMPLDDYLSAGGVGAFNKRIVEATLDTVGWRPSRVDGLGIDPARFEAYLPA